MVIRIANLDKCIKKFGDISGIDLMPEITEATIKVQRMAKDLAPVGTPESTGIPGYVGGTLMRSIHRKMYPKYQSGIVYTTLEYASYVEFGTVNKDGSVRMYGQPYMIPALDKNRAGINVSMKDYIRKQLKEKTHG